MNRINNLAELHAERRRLRLKLNALEKNINTDFLLIKEDLKPLHILYKLVNKIFHREDLGLVGAGLNFGIDVLIKKVFFRNANWISKLVVPFLVKNATSNIVASQGDHLIEFAKNIFKKWTNKNHKPIYDQGTVDSNY